jgi:hypothetical protein
LKNTHTTTVPQSTPQWVTGTRPAQSVRAQPSASQRIQTISTYQTAKRQRQSNGPQIAATAPSSISVRYLETSPIRVRGVVSGIDYQFSGSRAVQAVDARDASSLLSTRFFRRG